MGPSIGGKIICELNNVTGENEFGAALKYQAAHTYLAIEVEPVLFQSDGIITTIFRIIGEFCYFRKFVSL